MTAPTPGPGQAPAHHGQPMYRDKRFFDGLDMRRWLCMEPGCDACLSDDTLNAARDMAWAEDNGIQLPGVIRIGGDQ